MNPYAVAESVDEQDRPPLPSTQHALVGCLSGSISLRVVAMLLTVMALVVTVVYDMQPFPRDTNYFIITALLIAGWVVSLAVSLLAGVRSFQRVRKPVGTLYRPSLARAELEQHVVALLKDRESS